MPEYLRVRSKRTGHEYTIRAEQLVPSAQDVLDKPALDAHGEPAPMKPRVKLGGKSTKPPTIDEVLDEVGDDPAKAAAALQAEQARGEDTRTTLVSRLEAIAADRTDNNSDAGSTGDESGQKAENQEENG